MLIILLIVELFFKMDQIFEIYFFNLFVITSGEEHFALKQIVQEYPVP